MVGRAREVIGTRDAALAYQVSRTLISIALGVAAIAVFLVTQWVGALAVVVAAGVVLADSYRRVRSRRLERVMALHVVDAAVVGIALIASDLPALVGVAPYGYLLTGAALLLPIRKMMVVASWTVVWVAATLTLAEPIGSDAVEPHIVWIAMAVAMSVYLGATIYLSRLAADAIRDRGRLSERLRSSRARLHAIVESSPLIVFALDRNGSVTFTENEGLFAFGAGAGDVTGVSIYDLLPDAIDLHLAVQDVLAGGMTVARDMRIGTRAYQVRLAPEMDAGGVVTGLIGIATDETERIAAAEALGRKVEMEQLISRLSTHLIGLPPEEIEDGVALALESVAEFVGADRAVVGLATEDGGLARAQAYVTPGLEPVPAEYQRHSPERLPWLYNRLTSGRLFTVPHLAAIPSEAWQLAEVWERIGVNSVAIVPIFLFRQFAGAASIDSREEYAFTDDDLVLLRFMAEMLVAVLHRKRVHDQLQDLVRSKDEFIASVSHELRTPLTTVVGLADELRSRPDDFDREEQQEFHRLLAEQSAEVSDIVEDLLVVARADIGKVSIQPAEIELGPEINSVLRGFSDRDRVQVNGRDRELAVWADRTRLRQVVRNLISNALRYGGDEVVVSVIDDGEGLAGIEVADSGASVTAEIAEELFEPYRHTAQVEGRPPSIGLGLTVGRKLAQLMGGDLVFVPRDGWTVFRLQLPAVPDTIAEGFGVSPASQTLGAKSGSAEIEPVAGDPPADDEPAPQIDAAAS